MLDATCCTAQIYIDNTKKLFQNEAILCNATFNQIKSGSFKYLSGVVHDNRTATI